MQQTMERTFGWTPLTARIRELGFSARTLHRVARTHARISRQDPREVVATMTVADLLQHSAEDLLTERGLGQCGLTEVQQKLAGCGVSLRGGRGGVA